MKKLMVVLVAALGCAAFAEGQEGAACPAEGGKCPAAGAACPAEGVKGPARGPVGGPRRGMGGMRDGMMMEPIVRFAMRPDAAEKFGFSEEQKEKLKALQQERGKSGEAQKKLQEAMQKQSKLMTAESIDEAALMAAIDEVFALRCQIAKEQTKRVVAVKAILTPEQVQKIHDEMKKMFESRGDRGPRGKGPRRGGPGAGPVGPEAGKEAPAPEAK